MSRRVTLMQGWEARIPRGPMLQLRDPDPEALEGERAGDGEDDHDGEPAEGDEPIDADLPMASPVRSA